MKNVAELRDKLMGRRRKAKEEGKKRKEEIESDMAVNYTYSS